MTVAERDRETALRELIRREVAVAQAEQAIAQRVKQITKRETAGVAALKQREEAVELAEADLRARMAEVVARERAIAFGADQLEAEVAQARKMIAEESEVAKAWVAAETARLEDLQVRLVADDERRQREHQLHKRGVVEAQKIVGRLWTALAMLEDLPSFDQEGNQTSAPDTRTADVRISNALGHRDKLVKFSNGTWVLTE